MLMSICRFSTEDDDSEPAAKRQRRPSCPYSEVIQGHKVKPESVSSKYVLLILFYYRTYY